MKFNNTYTITNSSDCLQLYDLFSLCSIFATSFCIAFSLVGSTIYTRVGDHSNFFEDSDSEKDSDSEEEDDDQEEYDHLYYDELDNLEDRVLEKEDLEKLENVVVREKTPNGEVIMTYNHKSESFGYYCDDKNVKYMVLDTVARKFTIDNNCKSVCVNYKAEFEKAKVAILADQVTSTKTVDPPISDVEPPVVKKSIYAKFKNYNSNTNNTSMKKDVVTPAATGGGNKTEKIYILTEKANRFTYKGRISNYNTVEVTDTVYKKTIDFATFKKSLCEKSLCEKSLCEKKE